MTPPQAVEIVYLTMTPEWANVGERVLVEATVRNPTQTEQVVSVEVTVDDEHYLREDVAVAPNHTRQVSLSLSFDRQGTYEFAVDGQPVGVVTVTEKDPIEDSSLTPYYPVDESAPGFGIVAHLLAVLLAAAALARRENRKRA